MHRLSNLAALFAALFVVGAGCATSKPIVEGTYFAYSPLPNLTPDEPDNYWYHECELVLRENLLQLEMSPRVLKDGEVIASASDGGFYSYEGKLIVDGNDVVARIAQVGCDYCARSLDGTPYSHFDAEHIVRQDSDGSFVIGDLSFEHERDPRLAWSPQP